MRELDPEAQRFERVLAVGAHPDDAEYFAGGTLARLARAGARVALVVCTDGGRGGRGLEDAPRVRAAEQTRAAALVPFHEHHNLGRPDGALVRDEALVEALAGHVRRLRPELVLTHDPRTVIAISGERGRIGHSDHRAAGQSLLDALYPRAASPNFFPEQLRGGVEPWFPREVWLFDSATPDLSIDVTTTLDTKLEALRAHESQNGGDSLIRAAQRTGKTETFVRVVLRGDKRGS